MTPSSEPWVVTFYSFKGGVGRTMLLANVAAVLASRDIAPGRPAKVLVWDLDLEAPGMHRIEGLRPAALPRRGFLEWLRDVWLPANAPAEPDRNALDELWACTYEAPAFAGIRVLPPSGADAKYAELFASIDWHDVLVVKEAATTSMLRSVIAHLGARGGCEYVFLDSRTGVTDLGGLLAAVLPHATVLVGNYSAQSTGGLKETWQALDAAAAGQAPYRDARFPVLERFLVASPVPRDQDEAIAERKAVWGEFFPAGLSESWIEVPFDARLLVKERILATAEPDSAPSQAYRLLAARLHERRELAMAAQATDDARTMDRPSRRRRGAGDDDDRSTVEKGLSFEDRIAQLLRLSGYTVEREQLIGGNRVDLVARRKSLGRTEVYFVECKDHRAAVQKEVLEKLYAWVMGAEARKLGAVGLLVAERVSPAAITFGKDHPQELAIQTPDDLERELIDFETYLARLRLSIETTPVSGGPPVVRCYVRQRVLLERESKKAGDGEATKGEDLLDHAMKWARGQAGSKLWLLLGDYGTGKSVFIRRFAWELATRRAKDPTLPVPVLIDLKDFANETSFDTLVHEHLSRTLDRTVDAKAVRYLLSAGRLVLLLDSFDEMGLAAAQRSVDEQFAMLAAPAQDPPVAQRGNRILITCRPHFFKSEQQVKDTADAVVRNLADARLGMVSRRFDATIDELALFHEEQIAEFVRMRLGAEKAEECMRFIRDTYDLSALPPRPVLLDMIVKSVGTVAEGTEPPGTPADLYNRYTSQWIQDQNARVLQIPPELRHKILRRLALELWSRPSARIHHAELVRILEALPAAERAGLDPTRVDLELRTAAFLTRTRDGFYGFSHRSFLEYFYALFLLDSAARGPDALAEALNSDSPTPETAQFVAEKLVRGDANVFVAAFRTMLLTDRGARVATNAVRLASEMVLHMGKLSQGRAVEVAVCGFRFEDLLPARCVLRGADLRGRRLSGLDLSGAVLADADLTDAALGGANLDGADLRGARLVDVSARHLSARRANWTGATIEACDLREADLSDGDFTNAAILRSRLTDGARLTAACFRAAAVRYSRFARAIFHGAEFGEADLFRCTAPDAPGGVRIPGMATRRRTLHGRACARLHASATSVAFAPDGKTVLTGSEDGTARLFDTASGKEIRRFEGHGDWVRGVAFAPDGKSVLTGGDDCTARLFDAASGKEIRRFEGHRGGVRGVAFAPDGKTVLTGGDDRTVRLFDASSGTEVRRFEGHGGGVFGVAFAPDGKTVLTGSDDCTARLFDASSGNEIRRFEEHGGWVLGVAFAPDGKTVLTGGGDRMALLFDATSGKEIRRFEGHGGWVLGVAFAPDGKTVLTGGDDRTARLFDASSGREIRRFEGNGGGVLGVALAPDGKTVLTGGQDGTAQLFDASSGKEIRRFEGHGDGVFGVAFAPDGKTVLTGGGDGTARLFDASSGTEVRRFKGHGGGVLGVAFAPDGKTVLTGGGDRTARLFDVSSGKEIRRFEGHPGRVFGVAFAPDGKTVLTGGGDGTARLFDATSGKEIRRFEGHGGWVLGVAFTPDGKTVLTGSDDRTPRLFDASSGKEIRRFEEHGGWVLGVAFAPDGKTVLTGSDDRTAWLFDASSGKEVRRFEGHGGWVFGVAFAPDGQSVLTGGQDGTARLFDASSGKEIRRFEGHGCGVLGVAFAPDGRRIATGHGGGIVHVFDFDSPDPALSIVASHPRGGWATLLRDGRWRGEGAALDLIEYTDPEENELFPTIWHAEDLPDLCADGPDRGAAPSSPGGSPGTPPTPASGPTAAP